MDETSASFLDKTDWRMTIHRKLEACINAEGTFFYPHAVQSLISAVSAEFPNWDAKTEINDKIHEREIYYNSIYDKWVNENSTKRKWKKYNYERKLYMQLHKDVFEFVKQMLAKKRMLLWGTKRIEGGTQIPYEE